MPFGLKNAGATYQRLVDKMFGDLRGTVVEAYVDDMVIKSVTPEDHPQDLAKTLAIFDDFRMKLNPKKMCFRCPRGKIFRTHDLPERDRGESRQNQSYPGDAVS